MGKLREGTEAAITGFVTVTTAMPCLPTLPFVHFQPSDLQSILHMNPPHGSMRGGAKRRFWGSNHYRSGL